MAPDRRRLQEGLRGMRKCRYCGKTLSQVARLRKRVGYRVPCSMRPTPKGFHQYIYIPDVECRQATNLPE